MKPHPEYYIADIVSAAGGRLVSRIRLQKIAYLLDQLGTKSGFKYTYYHYGPYSRDLDSAVLDAEEFGLVEETFDRRRSDGARYSIFEIGKAEAQHEFTCIQDEALRKLVKKMASINVTVLELAATAHWLAQSEKVDDWKTEIRRRKGAKTENGRLDDATKLLAEVGLPPGASSQSSRV